MYFALHVKMYVCRELKLFLWYKLCVCSPARAVSLPADLATCKGCWVSLPFAVEASFFAQSKRVIFCLLLSGKIEVSFCDGIAIIVFRDAPVPAEDGGRPRRHEVSAKSYYMISAHSWFVATLRHGGGRQEGGRKWAGRWGEGGSDFFLQGEALFVPGGREDTVQ